MKNENNRENDEKNIVETPQLLNCINKSTLSNFVYYTTKIVGTHLQNSTKRIPKTMKTVGEVS